MGKSGREGIYLELRESGMERRGREWGQKKLPAKHAKYAKREERKERIFIWNSGNQERRVKTRLAVFL